MSREYMKDMEENTLVMLLWVEEDFTMMLLPSHFWSMICMVKRKMELQ